MKLRSQMRYTILPVYPPGVEPDPQFAEVVAQQTHGRVTALRGVVLSGDEFDADRVVSAIIVGGVIPDAAVYLAGALPLVGSPPLRAWLHNPAYAHIRCEVFRGNTKQVAHRIALWLTPQAADPRAPTAEPPRVPPAEPEWLHPEVEAAAQHLCSVVRVHEPWIRRLIVVRDPDSAADRIVVDRVPRYARFKGAPALSEEVGEHTRDLRGPRVHKGIPR